MIKNIAISELVSAVKNILAREGNLTNIPVGDLLESEEKIKSSSADNSQSCVCGACVMCTTAIPGAHPIHIEKYGMEVEISDLCELNKKDIMLAEVFKGCKKSPNGKCEITISDIENREWQMVDETKSQGKGKETLNHYTSYMICTKGPGIIYFISAGQALKSYVYVLLNEYIKSQKSVSSDFESELREQGFTDGYIKYLLLLHEKYPNWKFEAVITNVDYEDFLKYQIANQTKCADFTAYPVYCTNILFSAEESGKYYIATEDAIRFFSHPYSMLQTGEWKYENSLQFLKADQKLPKEYAEQVVSSILQKEDTEIVNAILNSNSCVNPVFMASIYSVEQGPVGEMYGGKKVYNLFNIGADGGRSDSLKYAYDNQWFTAEDCINGSEETLKSYIGRGQNTLYALDWDYQSFSNNQTVYQYATAVNDAEDKAIMLAKKNGQMFDLNYDFVFSIPVYENIPSYVDGDYVAFPDPNKVASGAIE